MIATEQISVYLNRLASHAPTPGGGAVGALHAAQAAALISMVANFTVGKRFFKVQERTQNMAQEAQDMVQMALQAADEDEKLFGALIAAYQLPRSDDEAKARRMVAIQAATVAATAPQVTTVDLSERVIGHAQELLHIGNPSVISDVAAAAEAARAALVTALVTLEMNIEAIVDEAKRDELILCAQKAQVWIEAADVVTQAVRDKVVASKNNVPTHTVLSGKPVAQRIRERIQQHVQSLSHANVVPNLAVILATDNEATVWYVKSIQKAAHAQGLNCEVHTLLNPSEDDLRDLIQTLNDNDKVHGIILQTPLPKDINASALINMIAVDKDIDGANPLSLGRLSIGQKAFAPATARSVMEILAYYDIALAGEKVVVVGRSAVVGKPLAQLLLKQDATVTLCHSRTQDLSEHTRSAKVVAVAVGSINLLTQKDVTADSIVIDVGTNINSEGLLVGDVAPDVADVVAALSPVPGGVGTVTTALLLLHTTEAALSMVGQMALS